MLLFVLALSSGTVGGIVPFQELVGLGRLARFEEAFSSEVPCSSESLSNTPFSDEAKFCVSTLPCTNLPKETQLVGSLNQAASQMVNPVYFFELK